MSQPQPSPEAMRAARDLLDQFSISYLGEPTAARIERIAAALDDAFRPRLDELSGLRESHERLRVAREDALRTIKVAYAINSDRRQSIRMLENALSLPRSE